ncbi:hypothetical protein 4L372X_025 [Aeromonas phage 4_L372X]|nr:hypothetical protein 4L372X_025 [Aeromonas phage 4_L372X]
MELRIRDVGKQAHAYVQNHALRWLELLSPYLQILSVLLVSMVWRIEMSKIFPNSRQRRKDASDMEAIKRRQDARRFIEKQRELEDLIKELSL